VKIEHIDVDVAITSVRRALEEDTGISPALRSSLEVLLLLVGILLNRIGLNSNNSSKPPSTDPDRERRSTRGRSGRKPGGQPGHPGNTLSPVDDPDEVLELNIDRRTLPKGHHYRQVGVERRQVIDLDIARFVTEYRAQVLEDEQGKRYVAAFPDRVTRPVQYGIGIKVHAVYLSQFQLLPYDRIRDQLQEQVGLPLSAGSVFNFNAEAHAGLDRFEGWIKGALRGQFQAHADETGINIDGKRHWLHCLSNDALTLFYPHSKRGTEAMDAMGVLPHYRGVLCHDHWKPYYRYTAITHALCNAHHLRELERAWEQDGQQWARQMQQLLLDINAAVTEAGGYLDSAASTHWRQRYRELLSRAEDACPPPDESAAPGKRGRTKRSKARNLLERLRDFEADVLRFMDHAEVPFTNNQGENDWEHYPFVPAQAGHFPTESIV
jgi:transposase